MERRNWGKMNEGYFCWLLMMILMHLILLHRTYFNICEKREVRIGNVRINKFLFFI